MRGCVCLGSIVGYENEHAPQRRQIGDKAEIIRRESAHVAVADPPLDREEEAQGDGRSRWCVGAARRAGVLAGSIGSQIAQFSKDAASAAAEVSRQLLDIRSRGAPDVAAPRQAAKVSSGARTGRQADADGLWLSARAAATAAID